MSTKTIIKSAAEPLHFVLVDFGKKIGKAWVERSAADMTREETVADIARGEWDRVDAVMEVDPQSGIARDVTAAIAVDVMHIWGANGDPLNPNQVEFIERFCGFEAARSFRRAA